MSVGRCSTCGKTLDLYKVKYHTPQNEPPVHIFCDAYCSNDWYLKNNKINKNLVAKSNN
tara:strand:+ start:7169 stop:7345 length:177 start_codon:yes stop_codon:yes gene_type:complete